MKNSRLLLLQSRKKENCKECLVMCFSISSSSQVIRLEKIESVVFLKILRNIKA